MMKAVPPVSPGTLSRALRALAEEGELHVVESRADGLAVLCRLRLLKGLLDDMQVVRGRYVIRDRRGCATDIRRELYLIAAQTEMFPNVGIEAAVDAAKQTLARISEERS
jgi:hypothetical protein